MIEEKKPGEGLKYDGGKPRWELLPLDIMEEVVKVLTFGSKKYKDHNWKKVENGKWRYFSATFRHLTSWYKGEENDPETGYSHLAHAICSIIFVYWHFKNEKENKSVNSVSCSEEFPICEPVENHTSDLKIYKCKKIICTTYKGCFVVDIDMLSDINSSYSNIWILYKHSVDGVHYYSYSYDEYLKAFENKREFSFSNSKLVIDLPCELSRRVKKYI